MPNYGHSTIFLKSSNVAMSMQGLKSDKSLQGSVPVKEIAFELIGLFIKSLSVGTEVHATQKMTLCRLV